MTNDANIPKPIGNVLVIGGRNQGKTLHATLELIEENTKLKTEIEQLKSEIEQWQSTNLELVCELTRIECENNQLKTELKQATNLMPKICETCEYEDEIGWKEPCNSCKNGSTWKWKGQV